MYFLAKSSASDGSGSVCEPSAGEESTVPECCASRTRFPYASLVRGSETVLCSSAICTPTEQISFPFTIDQRRTLVVTTSRLRWALWGCSERPRGRPPWGGWQWPPAMEGPACSVGKRQDVLMARRKAIRAVPDTQGMQYSSARRQLGVDEEFSPTSGLKYCINYCDLQCFTVLCREAQTRQFRWFILEKTVGLNN